MADLSGHIIKGYEFREQIGSGGFGAVYRAYQPIIEREVAIKVILPERANQPSFIRGFEIEAQVIARLEHPHIVPLHDYWREPNGAYLVMRYLRGGNLSGLLKNGQLEIETIAKILDQITAALAFAHHHKVVHRDLKPDNILLDKEGNAYLTDFGIAVPIGRGATDDGFTGSLLYTSPEQLGNEPATPAGDIYSLGIVLYEMLVGEHPFDTQIVTELIHRHLNELLPELPNHLPDGFNAIIQKATAKNPAERYADVRELSVLFQQVMGKDVVPIETYILETSDMVNPYKGLRAFREADVHDFFGREALTQQLIARLSEGDTLSRFLAVVGPSGSGKSSVVRAGLIPSLRKGAIVDSENWFIAEMIPGPNPLDELEVALTRVATKSGVNIMEQLERDERGLQRVAGMLLPDGVELLLVVDQFEEVFTLLVDEERRRHFLSLLSTAVTYQRSRVRVVITLRADFYDRPLMYPEFGELVRDNVATILPMTAKELENAIVNPAQRVGVEFEEGLAVTIASEVSSQPGALPLLQYALTELFENRKHRTLTHQAYQKIGGTVGALAKRADELCNEFSNETQEIVRQMFLRLVTLGEGVEDTRRRTPLSELVAITDDDKLLSNIIETFVEHRLLSLDHDPATRTPTIELAHEAILREWEQLRTWLNESRSEIRLQRQLNHMAQEWRGSDQDKSFLLRGNRLAMFQDWTAGTQLVITTEEREFLNASLAERERQEAEGRAQKEHEASLERRAQRILQGMVFVLLLATVAALILSAIARQNEQKARGLALASSAQLSLNEGNTDQAISEAETALEITENPLARYVLAQANFAPQPPPVFWETDDIVPQTLDSQDDELTFVLISHMGPGNAFGNAMVRGMEDACTLINATCHWLGHWTGDMDDMTAYWEEALLMKVDGIGTTIVEPETVRSYTEQAIVQGVPVIVFNTRMGQNLTSSLSTLLYIGSNEFTNGEENGRRIFAEAKADGKTIKRGVCFNQATQHPGLAARCAGVRSIFDNEGVALDEIPLSHFGSIPEEVASEIANYFADNPYTNAVFMLGPGPVAGLNFYFQQAGIEPGELYATTHDLSPEILQMIRDGYLLQAIDQQPYSQSFETIISLYLYTQYGLRPSGFIDTSSIVDEQNVHNVMQMSELGYR